MKHFNENKLKISPLCHSHQWLLRDCTISYGNSTTITDYKEHFIFSFEYQSIPKKSSVFLEYANAKILHIQNQLLNIKNTDSFFFHIIISNNILENKLLQKAYYYFKNNLYKDLPITFEMHQKINSILQLENNAIHYFEVQTLTDNLLLQIFKVLYRYNENLKNNETSIATCKMQQIAQWLHDNITQSLTIEIISREFATNPTSLKNQFKKEFNIPIMQYFKNLRMEWALKQLEKHQTSVQELSSILHYQNPQHFSFAFKKHFGITPRELLKKNQVIKKE